MRASYHVIASAGVALGFELVTHSWTGALGCFLSGVLIDTDHYLDYILIWKKFPLRYQDLKEFCWDRGVTKVYLIFHSYEFLALFWLLIYFLHFGPLWSGIALGLSTHMLFDQFTNPIKPWFYFLLFRAQNGFDKAQTLSQRYFQTP